MAKVFLDTNIFAYAVDEGDAEKFRIARRLLRDVESRSSGAVSTQVLQEFYNVATKRLRHDPRVVRTWIEELPHEIVNMQRDLVVAGIELSMSYQLAFYDALIVAAAQAARCRELYSEDMQHGMRIGSVRIVNPFA